MKKYLALAALLVAGNVYAVDTKVEVSANSEEVVVTEQDVKEALENAQAALKVFVEEVEKDEAAQDQMEKIAQ